MKYKFIFLILFSISTHAEDRVSVMAYNLENLFDTIKDESKQDYTFLPLTQKNTKEHRKFCSTISKKKWRTDCLKLDWSEENLNLKLNEVKGSILQAQGGKGPDILILEEVENINVLNRLNNLMPQKYKTVVLIEGKDIRGIDVAVLSRLPQQGEAQLHVVEFNSTEGNVKNDSRGILQVTLKLPNQETIAVFANHFPAPFHDKQFRIDSFKKLNSLLMSLPKGQLAIAGGDFNTTSTEDKKFNILKEYVEPEWIIAHKKYCEHCKGTSYYGRDNSWSFLDMLLISKSFEQSKSWQIDGLSFKVLSGYENQLNKYKTPQSFDTKTGKGVSDHLPVYVELVKK